MANNLRVIYRNLVDSATVTASSTQGVLVPANMKSDIKSLVWQSLSTGAANPTRANILIDVPTITIPTGTLLGIVACFSNLSYLATIRVKFYSTASVPNISSTGTPAEPTGGTVLYDSGTILCNQYANLGFSNWRSDIYSPITSTTTSYRDKKVYSRVWLPELAAPITSCSYITLEIIDDGPMMINDYFEISRLIIGPSWTPTYNTSFGLESGVVDLSVNNRSEAGDLFTSNAPSYNTLKFDLKYMNKSDRTELNKILKLVGTKKPIFVSLFPDSTTDWDMEQQYQIYGKLSTISGIQHTMNTMYSSSVEIEEI
jgi:hypothetical protein